MAKLFTEDEAKQLAWLAFMSRTTESEYFYIHRREAKSDFEKWWDKNSKIDLNQLLKNK